MNGTMLVGVLLGILGIAILIATIGLLPMVGMFLLMWGNNMIMTEQIERKNTQGGAIL